MKFRATILDSRGDSTERCYLCRIHLEDYVQGLPSTYQDYDVQREIVSNVYLDHLVETVLQRKHIPPIVLVIEKDNFAQYDQELEIRSFKILDGLQRTFRLQAIRKTIQFCLDELDSEKDYLDWNKFKFSRQFSAAMRERNSTSEFLRSVIEGRNKLGDQGLLETFSKNGQWFEVWTGLTADEEVRKMLTLNAGHKPVKTRHQLELLFLNLLPILQTGEAEGFDLVREKEVSSTQFSKDRTCGSFHFAHVITALLSFYTGKPVTPSSNLIQDLQTNDTSLEEYREFLSPDFLMEFVVFLVRLDRIVSEQYRKGVLWMGREVSLAGLFGALGSISDNSDNTRYETMRWFLDLVRQHNHILNLDQFEEVRNGLDLSKVNIGNINRSAVFSAVRSLAGDHQHHKIDWRTFFAR